VVHAENAKSEELVEVSVADHVVQLEKAKSELVKQLELRSVADKMLELHMLRQSEHTAIILSDNAAQTLVNILLKSKTDLFGSFLAALQHTNQEHILRLVVCAGTYHWLAKTTNKIFKRNKMLRWVGILITVIIVMAH